MYCKSHSGVFMLAEMWLCGYVHKMIQAIIEKKGDIVWSVALTDFRGQVEVK